VVPVRAASPDAYCCFPCSSASPRRAPTRQWGRSASGGCSRSASAVRLVIRIGGASVSGPSRVPLRCTRAGGRSARPPAASGAGRWRVADGCARGNGGVAHETLAGWGADQEYACGVAVDAEAVRHTHRDDRGAARLELEALGSGLDRQPPFEQNVALVLRVCVEGRRGVPGEDELVGLVGLADCCDRARR
jgi:hypothetical protein